MNMTMRMWDKRQVSKPRRVGDARLREEREAKVVKSQPESTLSSINVLPTHKLVHNT